MAESGDASKRQVAYKTSADQILTGSYVKEDGWLPNYVLIGDKKASRVNLIGVLISKMDDGFVIDDGTGRVSLRFYNFGELFSVGDIVNIIGRPREFGTERYLVPEIVRKVTDSRWVELRKQELTVQRQETILAERKNNETKKEESSVETEDLSSSNPISRIFEAIKTIDSGSGAGFDEIIVKTKVDDIDVYIRKLLEQGDIFEIRPGRYKVLE